MARQTREYRILEQLIAYTHTCIDVGQLCGASAQQIATQLSLDRTNVSKELNKLYRGGRLIKLQGKPTLYLHRDTLSAQYPFSFLPATIPVGGSIVDYLEAVGSDVQPSFKPELELEHIIGAQGSLAQVVENAIAAVAYPPFGLHTLICGSSGVGKQRFARTMYNHGIALGRFAPNTEPIIFSCQDYIGSPNLLISQLFGFGKGAIPGSDKGRRGLVEQAAGSMLFLDGVHKLPHKVQELLITLIEKNTFSRLGEASTPRAAGLMIVASTTEPFDSALIEKLVLNFPVTIKLSNLDDRTPGEILEHLLLFLGREATQTGLTLRVHRDALACLACAPYPGNIGEMKGIVKLTASAAFLECLRHDKAPLVVDIGIRHLPEAIQSAVYSHSLRPHELHRLFESSGSELLIIRPGEPVQLPINEPAKTYEQLSVNLLSNESPCDESSMDSYISQCLSCLRGVGSRKAIRQVTGVAPQLEEIVRSILLPYSEYQAITSNDNLLYGLLLHLNNMLGRQQQSMPSHSRGSMNLTHPKQYATACQLADTVERTFGVAAVEEDLSFITLYLYLASKWSLSRHVGILVVMHGTGVAEGVASLLRNSYDSDSIYGISFAGEMSVGSLLPRLSPVVEQLDQGSGVLILSDMEPLGSLHYQLTKLTGVTCETICGLNLATMLSLTHKAVKQSYALSTLIKESGYHRDDFVVSAPVASGSFIDRIVDEILGASLTFLNPTKSADVLLAALDAILDDLGLVYSDEIAIKFIFHCSHMLERVIRNEPLAHPKLRTFVNRYSSLLLSVEQRLSNSAEVFGITIPSCELAYVCEIFLPYLEH